MPKFFLYTFGCRCNQSDSAAIRESLCNRSLAETRDSKDADLVVVNTCTVTRRTDQQVRQAVRKLHRENPNARVVVTGCYAQRDPDSLAAISGVSLVVGNAAKDRLVELISDDSGENAAGGGRIIHGPFDADRDYLLSSASQTGGKTRPFVKLQDGCDARCSYCIVPTVRGPARSARAEDVLDEIRSLVRQGFQEIVLTGVHLGTYGRKLENSMSLPELLRRILDVPGLGRLRLSSIEPMRFHRAIVRLAVAHPAFAPHFHIPLQSGSDRILRRMRRPYRADAFLDMLSHIHENLPRVALGTDVLVGFPGESDADFEQTCDLVQRSPLSYLHVFPFSALECTDAWTMPDQVPASTVRARARVLRDISQAKNLAFRSRFVGEIVPALTIAKEEQLGDCIVLTDNYIHAQIEKNGVPPNRLVRVRIDRVSPDRTFATLVD